MDFNCISISEICSSDSCLEQNLKTYMSNPKIRFKFEKFLKLLEDLQKTTTWVQMFRWRRALVIGSNLLRNILNLFDFLKVSSN